MGVPNVVYKWKSLRTLYFGVFVMNVAGCVIVVIMTVSAVKLRIGVGQYFDTVIPGDANFWPGMMFLIAILCAPIYAIGTKLCFHLRFFSPDSVPRLNQLLFVNSVLCFASSIVLIFINAIGMLHLVNFQRINHNGIIESMKDYGTEIVAKIRVDMIQINFRCCGSKSFKDWFHVRWMQKEGDTTENQEHNESIFASNDVPFSCCATEILQPCVHHNILKPSEVYLYKPEHRLTIATNGCHAKVLGHVRYVGGMLIVALTLLAAYQMILALLSRLLQTAHSNASYIGPRKGRYLGWILGSMPNAETYNRLVYEGREAPAGEMIPLCEALDYRLSKMDECYESKKSLGRTCSKILNADRNSSIGVRSQGAKIPSVAEVVEDETPTSSTSSDSVPTPPHSPRDKSISGSAAESKKYVKEEMEGETDAMNGRRCVSRGLLLPKVKEKDIKKLRESLERLEKYHQSPWRGGSPVFETSRPSCPVRRSSRVDGFVEKGEDSFEGNSERRRSSSGSSSSSYGCKKPEIFAKDSIEEDEMRMKKFCKDLSTEYNESPCSKQRRDFSEEYKLRDPARQPRPRDADSGRLIRNEVRAKFNPADTYSRFRGSVQDTMMRRSGQTRPGPPPIPMSDQRAVPPDPRCVPRQRHPENPPWKGRAVIRNHLPKPQVQIGSVSWKCPPAPTYFPISSRPPRPPRLPPCPRGAGNRPCQTIRDHSRGVRPLQFVQNAELAEPRYHIEQGRRVPGMQPPRFSGCR